MRVIRSWFSLIDLAVGTLWLRKKQTFLLVTLITLLMMILQMLLSRYGASEYAVYEMRNIWKLDEKETYHLGMAYVTPEDVGYTERLYGYLEEVKKIPQIAMVGKFYWTGSDVDGQSVKYLNVDQELLDFAQIYLPEHTLANGIYLGADFKEQYQVGDIFDGDYIVEGFLPDDTKWPTASRLLTGTEVAYDLNRNALLFESESAEYGLLDGLLFNQNIYFTMTENADIAQVKQELLSLSEKYNVGVYIESLEELYNNYLQENDLVRGKYRFQIILALAASVLTITTACLISLWVLRTFYGVLYACGYTQNNMIIKAGIENFLMFAFAIGLSYIFMRIYIAPLMDAEKYWYEAWNEIAIIQTVKVACGIWLLSNIVPAIYIHMQMPWSLLKEK